MDIAEKSNLLIVTHRHEKPYEVKKDYEEREY